MGKTETKKNRQWHPVVYAGLQIELEEDANNLHFENEYQLGTMPKEIDFLVIKKDTSRPIHKNIGQIFRGHNIIEYKSPNDYLSVDDFYKAYGYSCFYKADSPKEDIIKSWDMTLSFICHRMPKKLLAHLKKYRRYQITKRESGIYDISGDEFPIQFIITSQLDGNENLWLKSLLNPLKDQYEAEKLVRLYEKNKQNHFYESVMDMIIRENVELFKGGTNMSALDEILDELMYKKYGDEIEKTKAQCKAEGVSQGRAEGISQGRAEGKTEGRIQGIFALIQDNLEEGKSREKICTKLQKYFDLTLENAMAYIEEFQAK